MSKEIIKSIEINIGDTTVKVSLKQAKELFTALAALLGEQIVKVTYAPSVYPGYPWTFNGSTCGTVYASGTATYTNPLNTETPKITIQ